MLELPMQWLELDRILVHTDLVWSGRRPFVYSISKMISTLKYGLLEDGNESQEEVGN
jgi:hypothetical protein